MLWNAKNGTIPVENTVMDYIQFGSGARFLIMLPGLGDGLRTVKGAALPFAAMYRMFCKDFTVLSFSRRQQIPEGQTTLDMARDVKHCMDVLGVAKADVFGVSMGGMIAQHLASEYPERVGKLILAVTCARPNAILVESVSKWLELADRGDHTALMDDNLRKIYSDEYYRKNKYLVPVMGALTKPKSYDRFRKQAQACLSHASYDRLPQIQAPTLVIGGEQDKTLGGDASREIAARIPGARLRMYERWGHGVYEEEPEFNSLVLEFLKE